MSDQSAYELKSRNELLLLKALSVLLSSVLAILLAAYLLNPAKIWIWEYHLFAGFNPSAALFLAAAILFAWVAAGRLPSRLFNLILPAILTAMYATVATADLGDHDPWFYLAATSKLFRSEMLANLAYHLSYVAGLNINLVPVIAGFATGVVFLSACDEILGEGSRRLFSLAYIGCSLQGLFFRGYVENTQLSIPLLLLFITFAIRYLRDPSSFSLSILYAGACLAGAVMIHAENLFLTPALLALIGIKRLLPEASATSTKSFFAELVASTVTSLVLIVVIHGTLSALGLHVVSGYESGREPMFVKLTEPLPIYQDFTMFSMAHFAFVGNIVVTACPAFPALFFALFRLIKRQTIQRGKDLLFLMILTLGYFCFIMLWSFDLGFPGDFDLMLSMSSPFVLLTLWVVKEAFSSRTGTAIVVASIPYVWATVFLWLR